MYAGCHNVKLIYLNNAKQSYFLIENMSLLMFLHISILLDLLLKQSTYSAFSSGSILADLMSTVLAASKTAEWMSLRTC